MSATYKCNFCDTEMTKHISSKHQDEYVHKKLFGDNPNISSFHIRFTISTHQEDLDVCDKCFEKMKVKAIKEISIGRLR